MTPRSKKEKKVKEVNAAVNLYDVKGHKEGTVDLDKSIFTGEYSVPVLHQAVRMYMANKRLGLADTKVRNEVAGGNKKPWKQKGTGRARVGSIRNPIWIKGGIVFGPHPRSFKYDLPKKIKSLSLLHSLNAKLSDGKLSIIKDFKVDQPKTKNVQAIVDKLKMKGSILIAVESKDKNLALASRNIAGLTVARVVDINTYDVLKHKNFVVTENGLKALTERLKV